MKIQETTTQTITKTTGIQCDACKITYDVHTDPNGIERQEFLHYHDQAGYGSIFGDGNFLSLDLCQHCVKKHLGNFLINTPSFPQEMISVDWEDEDYI